ncbi:MAG: hypothetical protein JSR62_03630 [Nitrospira sp.]|nr:hypothetical protein [Nitrospira sp.]
MKDEYVNDDCNPERWHQAIRAEMIARSEEFAEAFAEEWQAEEPYLRLKATKRRKSHDKAAYLAAKERYEKACHNVHRVIDTQRELYREAELAALNKYFERPKLTDPTQFTTWLRKHVELYFKARLCPARVVMAPIWKHGIRAQYEQRYLLFATLHRVFMADGVEAAMRLYQEEIAQKLHDSVWATSETEKIKGNPAQRNGRYDGGYYETSIQADLTPWIAPGPIPFVARAITEMDAHFGFDFD